MYLKILTSQFRLLLLLKFDDLHKIFIDDFKTDRLADIYPRELGVSPQVVSNWKSETMYLMNTVRKLRELKKNLREGQKSNQSFTDLDLKFGNDISPEEGEPIIKNLVMIYKKLLKKIKKFFSAFTNYHNDHCIIFKIFI